MLILGTVIATQIKICIAKLIKLTYTNEWQVSETAKSLLICGSVVLLGSTATHFVLDQYTSI